MSIPTGDDLPLVTNMGPHRRMPIPRNFYPFTATGEVFRRKYPDLDEMDMISDFVNYHMGTGKMSTNWDAEFIGFCNHRQRQARSSKSGERTTDSMGFSMEPGGARLGGSEGDYGRRFLDRYNEHISAGLGPNEARLATERDLEGDGQ